ncbi:hypothetical protein [Pseudomonas floridensis]|uniref:hypothetical protein n=1 Tax=Pseudomonas floridensis TaxID=1958950 RepID=UPI0012FF84F8|nr:hypothetical protein [Pseudomonas floridensis]
MNISAAITPRQTQSTVIKIADTSPASVEPAKTLSSTVDTPRDPNHAFYRFEKNPGYLKMPQARLTMPL